MLMLRAESVMACQGVQTHCECACMVRERDAGGSGEGGSDRDRTTRRPTPGSRPAEPERGREGAGGRDTT
jgi:hypothetical protein